MNSVKTRQSLQTLRFAGPRWVAFVEDASSLLDGAAGVERLARQHQSASVVPSRTIGIPDHKPKPNKRHTVVLVGVTGDGKSSTGIPVEQVLKHCSTSREQNRR
eukprot:6208488-Amphidinium_carterae.1